MKKLLLGLLLSTLGISQTPMVPQVFKNGDLFFNVDSHQGPNYPSSIRIQDYEVHTTGMFTKWVVWFQVKNESARSLKGVTFQVRFTKDPEGKTQLATLDIPVGDIARGQSLPIQIKIPQNLQDTLDPKCYGILYLQSYSPVKTEWDLYQERKAKEALEAKQAEDTYKAQMVKVEEAVAKVRAEEEAKRAVIQARIAKEDAENARLLQEEISRLPKKFRDKVREGTVSIGMTSRMVELSWGMPNKVNRSVGSWGSHEQWCYSGNTYVYIQNGKVSGWQD